LLELSLYFFDHHILDLDALDRPEREALGRLLNSLRDMLLAILITSSDASSPSTKSISVTKCTMKRRIVSSSCWFRGFRRALASSSSGWRRRAEIEVEFLLQSTDDVHHVGVLLRSHFWFDSVQPPCPTLRACTGESYGLGIMQRGAAAARRDPYTHSADRPSPQAHSGAKVKARRSADRIFRSPSVRGQMSHRRGTTHGRRPC
jgi:hypothetical protein